jgi:hypothetical protein
MSLSRCEIMIESSVRAQTLWGALSVEANGAALTARAATTMGRRVFTSMLEQKRDEQCGAISEARVKQRND